MNQRLCSPIPVDTALCPGGTKRISQAIAALSYPLVLLVCLGSTYIVPDDELTIQAAIDSSASGDTILVRQGTYVENLHTLGKTLTLKALGTPEATIIDGNQQGSVIEVTGDAHIEGFTIRNGWNEDGGGILALGDPDATIKVAIVGNIITENQAGSFDVGLGGGVALAGTMGSVVDGNVIEGNYAGDSGGGIAGGNITITNNIIARNGCHVGGGGIRTYGDTEITGNLVLGNWSDWQGGGIQGGAAIVRGNTIVQNRINNTVTWQGAGLDIEKAVVEQNIVALNLGPAGRGTGVGIKCSDAIVRCNDSWGNDVDYDLLGGCDTTSLGNFSEDPKFCNPDGGNFELDAQSPCAAENSMGCGLLGAYSVGCVVPVLRTTWGRLKSLYRSVD